MGFFPDEDNNTEYIEVMVPVLPRSFYSDSEWIDILTRGISPQGECVEMIPRPKESPYAEILRAMKKGDYNVDK